MRNNTHKTLDNTQYCVYNIIKSKRFMKGVDEKNENLGTDKAT